MSVLLEAAEGSSHLLMGNEAIARGALEAGMSVAAGYPGTPSSEILENLARVAEERNLYVEWSTNEKVALEVAAAASFAGLRTLCVMKQNGVNVASDFLLHLAGSGTRGGMILVTCDDPGALSSVNEGESRHFARMIEIPLLEPGDFQEAKDMTKWAFDLSEDLGTLVMLRSVTRMSHASGNVRLGALPEGTPRAEFKADGSMLDPNEGPVLSMPVAVKHGLQQERIAKARDLFERSPFNTYEGPDRPEVLIVTSSACTLYSREAVQALNLQGRVGLLKLGTTWPLPPNLLKKYLVRSDRILIVEEVLTFLEENVKVIAAEEAKEIGIKTFYGKNDGTIPMRGELSPDLVIGALSRILDVPYQAADPEYEKKAQAAALANAPQRGLAFCPGCPHRASYWNIRTALKMDDRDGFVCGDIGCYTLDVFPGGAGTLKTLHSMGSGTGVASGFGKLGPFGLNRPVLSVCGDSTFFHAAMPALVNAVHHRSNITMIILDNSGTAMTGFQSHPGLCVNAMGQEAPDVDIAKICAAIGAKVEIGDPFDFAETRETLNRLMEDEEGVKVLILRQKCALSPEKRGIRQYNVRVDEALCIGEDCGCNRLCTRIFRCPALVWDTENRRARVDEVLCAGCGVCTQVCPQSAIRKEVA
ncbi:MAG: indolepyruvate ferredoxin oxidoreductase [Deltaproteobacteria bacterium HGW-Deltaproteobacteria-19]|jgi:indolepyruvate ferredoxin oxidoreductase alpha subunit|nr:MAG: indolepyruvate ferredoxin oxidoreductase [Deltaproteobacteria bacterium HGW-Deltaproteobacteria-19]